MAGKGRVPAPVVPLRPRGTAIRRLVASGTLGGFPLPKNILKDENGKPVEWHPATVKWWEHWRRSPQAARMLTEPDWDDLLDTALLHHQMWADEKRRLSLAAEVRLRVAKFGATPEDRLRLRLEVDEYASYPVGYPSAPADQESIAERRKRLTAPDISDERWKRITEKPG